MGRYAGGDREVTTGGRMKLYKSPLAYGICTDVKKNSEASADVLERVEKYISYCHMPYCGKEAVRIGVFNLGNGEKVGVEYRGLCKRHRQIGMWSDSDTAWGW